MPYVGSRIAPVSIADVSNNYVSSTFASNTFIQAQGYGTGDVSNNYLQAQGYGAGNVANNYLQAQGYGTGDVSNNYLNTTLSTKVDETHTGDVSVTGDVGIGITSPSHQLHLKETGASGTGIFIEASNDTAGYEIARTAATGLLDLKGTQNTYSGFTFSTTDGSGTTSERMRITNAGNVGIGTQSPAYKLDVVDDINGSHVSRVNNINTGSTSQSFFQLVAGGRYTNLRTNYTGRYFQISGSNIENFYQDFDTHFFRNSAGTNTMVINSSGHVTKPDQPLFVGRLDAYTSTTSNYVIGVTQTDNRSMTFDSSTDRITVPTSGYYMLHAQQLYQSSGGIYLSVRVNGSTKFFGYGNLGTTHRDLVATGIWYLNANDYVDFFLQGTSTYSWTGGHSLCYVQLVQ